MKYPDLLVPGDLVSYVMGEARVKPSIGLVVSVSPYTMYDYDMDDHIMIMCVNVMWCDGPFIQQYVGNTFEQLNLRMFHPLEREASRAYI